MALGLRYGDFSLPTAANPTHHRGRPVRRIRSASILDQVPAAERALLARYTSIVTGAARRAADTDAAEQAMAAAGLAYPVVAKPDIGCNGTGVRLVADRAALARYLAAFPRNACVLLQEFIPDEGEAGLFYIRHPDEARGRITSITLNMPAVVTGDGRSTLRELILADPRAGRVAASLPAAAARTGWMKCRGRASGCGWSSSATTARARSSATAPASPPRR